MDARTSPRAVSHGQGQVGVEAVDGEHVGQRDHDLAAERAVAAVDLGQHAVQGGQDHGVVGAVRAQAVAAEFP
jgi:hypothetical protein